MKANFWLSGTSLALSACLGLAACSKPPTPAEENKAAPTVATAEQAAAPADSKAAAATTALPDTLMNPKLGEYIKTLSSDEFQGRAPATKGEELTLAYISEHFKNIGLKPLVGDSFVQPVQLVQIDPKEVSAMTFSGDKAPAPFKYRDQMFTWTTRVTELSEVKGSDMVFVGYGIVAPEYNWNDYEGLDVKGKTVVMFVNDPGFATKDPALFTGEAMTYYGRWTYKFEEAARQGAAMALIVHETDAASYGWHVVAGGSATKFDLINPNKNADRAAVEGWVTTESANTLFATIGEDIESMRKKALSKDFAPIPLNIKASVSVKNNVRELTSGNVAGFIEGTEKPDEVVLYMAHWDHLGVDFSNPKNKVFNGAVDNASGTGGLMALAEYYASQPKPKRSVAFVAVTAEERGLLGSAWYAKNPLFPLNKTIAGINMDVMNVNGPMKDMVVVGHGNSELEVILEKYTKEQGRYIAPEPNPAAGSYYRSDHFNLAKAGVPMLYAKGGVDSVAHGKEWGLEQAKNFNTCCYHKVEDEYNDSWDLSGAQQDLFLYYRVGRELADSNAWPNWYQGKEFKAARDASLAGK
ncbi:MAG TPA: peptidase M28 [Rheinheimera sp.]|uniref:M28 family metallopeptidase n=1 Tax=Rheinheimera sp. TaxID=1869214 RepID=UPI000EC3AE85|nr:M28 family metallopeptidase [Rheinheimera sp.]HCU66550.1 peptidase M28 [Rheinheimera sp.]